VYSDAEAYNENIILKILKWLSNKTATLHQTVRESVPQDKGCGSFSDTQLLVTLLRALGLRVRLVMVLNPIPYKESKASGKGKSMKGSEEKVSSQDKELSEEGMELTVESDKSQSKSGSGGGKIDNGGTSKNTTGTTGKKVRQSTDEGSSSSCTAQKGTRNRSQTAKQRKQRSTSTSSPYFKKQTRRRSTRTSSRDMEEGVDPGNLEQSLSKQSSGSDSEYVPEKVTLKKRNLTAAFEGVEDHDDDDDDDDVEQPKKKRRRSSSKLVGATPAKKLKQAADRKAKAVVQSKPLKSSSKIATSRRKSKSTTTSDSKDDDSNQARESGSKNQSMPVALQGEDSNLIAATNSDTNQSRGSSLESVEILKSEETACWAEVYLTVAGRGGGMGGGRSRGEAGEIKNSKERWTCVHLPSLSVDQPHLCEKHCAIPLHYVIAIENGEIHVQFHVYIH
jgi:hypothetical protein